MWYIATAGYRFLCAVDCKERVTKTATLKEQRTKTATLKEQRAKTAQTPLLSLPRPLGGG